MNVAIACGLVVRGFDVRLGLGAMLEVEHCIRERRVDVVQVKLNIKIGVEH
jgi:hypothetical protein